MVSGNYKPAQTSYGRVFLIDGMAQPYNAPDYASYLKLTGLSQSYGDITKIEMPDPDNYGKYIEVGSIRGSEERVTSSLVGRYPAAIKSSLMSLANGGCSFDVQYHIGECTDPSDFNTFSKAIILEDVMITAYNTEDLGSLGSDENAKVDETAEISAKRVYEVLPLSFSSKANDIITNEILSVAIADTASCGDCGESSDGCYKIFALTTAAGGSPSTSADVVFSIDKGVNWYAHDIDSLLTAEVPNDIAGIGDYIVVVSNQSLSLHYALKSEFDGVTDPAFTEVSTGFVSGKGGNAISSLGRKAFIVGNGGYVYYTDDPTSGVEVIDAGSATVDNLLAVHALSENYAIAVGNNGTVIKTTNKVNWSVCTKPVGVGVNVTACWMKDEDIWFVGTSNGMVYYTRNAGETWTQITMPGTAPTSIKDIKFSSNSVGYIAAVVSSRGRMYRTFDGGNSWTVLPENVGTFPLCDSINKIAVCQSDKNFVVGGGLADNGTDGFLVIGSV